MEILITGISGFAGSTLALTLQKLRPDWTISGVDSYIRPGSELNRRRLKEAGIRLTHADIRSASDFESLPPAKVLIDAAANASVLAGVDGQSSSRQLIEHNLLGTINMLEWCKANQAAFILLSTSRVYSIPPLAGLPVDSNGERYELVEDSILPDGVGPAGVSEDFSTMAPVSLYGATKLTSEQLALEYGATFNFPVWVNRCGVMAGAGQFGRADQGIVAFWINAHLRRRALKYIGFNGLGHQVRDCFHPADLGRLMIQQIEEPQETEKPRLVNLGGGAQNSFSLAELTAWANHRFGDHEVKTEPKPRPFDIPWMVMDAGKAKEIWNWTPKITKEAIFEEIATHAEANPDWLDLSL